MHYINTKPWERRETYTENVMSFMYLHVILCKLPFYSQVFIKRQNPSKNSHKILSRRVKHFLESLPQFSMDTIFNIFLRSVLMETSFNVFWAIIRCKLQFHNKKYHLLTTNAQERWSLLTKILKLPQPHDCFANYPDLNPVDYCVWEMLDNEVHWGRQITNV